MYNCNYNYCNCPRIWPSIKTTLSQYFVFANYFREFLIWGFFTKFKIRESTFSFNSAIIIIIFARFLNLRIYPPRKN